MKVFKIIAILFVVYVGIVVIFESLLGYYQPAGEGTLVITTTDDAGAKNDRVLSRLESQEQIFVAANHWPRAWFNEVLANPNVEVTIDGEKAAYVAVPATDDEHERLSTEFAVGTMFRILTGFPPRYFVRLDPA